MSESFKYVGDGKESPTKCHFMSAYRFYLNGAYVEVTDEHIIEKLKGNRCFKIKEVKLKKEGAKKKAPTKKNAAKIEE